MLVRATLKIPPEAGQTVIPRLAMVVMNGNEYAFVQKEPGDIQRRCAIRAAAARRRRGAR